MARARDCSSPLPAVGRDSSSAGGAVAESVLPGLSRRHVAANAEPVYLDATTETGHLPDLEALASDEELLRRTVAFYLCSPANPQGAMAERGYLLRALEMARRYNFMLFADECYSEIYTREAPVGALEVAATTPERFRNLVVFNSLSKRSNLPG